MNGNLRKLVVPAAILGVALVAIAVVYFAEPAHSLPSFFPGHVSASEAEANHHHTKHGIAALILALACFAFAWFQTGPKARTGATGPRARPGDSEGEDEGADRA
jgi:NADH:ubiquinone oxidoreductase subunit 5 (subunit L)/multisubunit Na+/H+ antiporter MnhA subunit